MENVGRNEPCPCGSGKRAKYCCYRLAAERVPTGDAVVVNATRSLPAVERAQGDAGAHFTWATRLLTQGNLESAVEHLRRAVALAPDGVSAAT